MNVVLDIPDDFAERLAATGDLARAALEALALEAYRAGRLAKPELRRLLGFGTRGALDGFLKAHEIYEAYPADEIERQRRDVLSLGY